MPPTFSGRIILAASIGSPSAGRSSSYASRQRPRYTVKSPENTIQFRLSNAGALVLYAQDHKALVQPGGFHGDIDLGSRVFHGVINQVRDRRPDLFQIAEHGRRAARLITQSFRRDAVERAHEFHTGANDLVQVDPGWV